MNQSDRITIADDMTVRRLGYGAMRLTGPDVIGPPEDEDAACDLLQTAVDLGVEFIDTADSYGPGVSERLIGAAIDPDDAVVATKAGLLRTTDGDWLAHGDPDYIHNQALVSRDRLGVDSIDLYQFHTPRSETPFEDSITAFAELKDAGIVDHIGLSNVSVDQLETALEHVDIVTVQNQYNVGHREDEDVLSVCEEYDICFIPWFPLGAGSLDGDESGADGGEHTVEETLREVAQAHDATPYQVALAWLLRHSSVMLPIPGTSDPGHLRQNLRASHLSLSDEEYAQLERLASPAGE